MGVASCRVAGCQWMNKKSSTQYNVPNVENPMVPSKYTWAESRVSTISPEVVRSRSSSSVVIVFVMLLMTARIIYMPHVDDEASHDGLLEGQGLWMEWDGMGWVRAVCP